MPVPSVGDLASEVYRKALRNLALLATKPVDNRSRRNARQATDHLAAARKERETVTADLGRQPVSTRRGHEARL